MGDVLKEIWEAANNRVRSPFVGSIVFVFLAVNWRPVFNLLFGDSPVLVRIAHFDNLTTWVTLYLWPIVGGVAFALASPWLQHVGALWARLPNAKLKNLQDEAAHQHQITEIRRATELEETRAAEEDARERRKIDAAKREKEAEEVGGQELLQKLPRDTVDNAIPAAFLLAELSKGALKLLSEVSKTKSGRLALSKEPSGRAFLVTGEAAIRELEWKEFLIYSDVVAELLKFKLFEQTGDSFFLLTRKGFEVADMYRAEIVPKLPAKQVVPKLPKNKD